MRRRQPFVVDLDSDYIAPRAKNIGLSRRLVKLSPGEEGSDSKLWRGGVKVARIGTTRG